MADVSIDHRACRTIPAPVSIFRVLREKSDMVPLPDDDDCDRGVDVELLACVWRRTSGTGQVQDEERHAFQERQLC